MKIKVKETEHEGSILLTIKCSIFELITINQLVDLGTIPAIEEDSGFEEDTIDIAGQINKKLTKAIDKML